MSKKYEERDKSKDYDGKKNPDEKFKKSISYDTGVEKKKKEWVQVEMGVFFDGTLNNMMNTDATTNKAIQTAGSALSQGIEAYEKQRSNALKAIEGDVSTGNDYTNVVRLFDFYEPK
jgi:outer membrane cobalamin receptor